MITAFSFRGQCYATAPGKRMPGPAWGNALVPDLVSHNHYSVVSTSFSIKILLSSAIPLSITKVPIALTMKREDITYLGAGPASLPTDVLATAAQALQNYQDTGL